MWHYIFKNPSFQLVTPQPLRQSYVQQHAAVCSGWAAITFPGILAVGKVSPGCIGYALCVRVNTWVMSNMLYLNAQGFKLFMTDI